MSGIKVVPSVFTIIEKDNKVLLLRRHNTGYMDGWYDLPAGHLENREKLADGAVRELQEETGLIARSEDLVLVHLYQNHSGEPPHYGHIFVAKKWRGVPKIMEPDKCDDVQFFDVTNLPEKAPPYTRQAIENFKSGVLSFSYHPPGSIKP